MTREHRLVSLVIPVKDEAENIPSLAEEITRAFDGTGLSWECLWIDDGSTDGTLEVLRRIRRSDDRHCYVSFDGNYGQTSAMLAGFRLSRGDILATMDGDGQNDPADLPPLIRRIAAGEADMINGVRVRRRDSWVRKASSRIGNGFRNWITGEKITDVGCSLRVFRRACVEGFPSFEGLHRFFPTLVGLQGWRIIESPVNHRPRLRGKAKYGIRNRLRKGLIDSFAVRWMQWRRIRYRIKDQAITRSEGDAS